jgi:hypothetical protein
MRAPAGRLRRPLAGDGSGAAAAVGTVMLVVITVAMVVVVGLFVFTLVQMPDDPPEVKVALVHINDRWSVSVSSVSEELPISDFRLLAYKPDGDLLSYDSNCNGVWDQVMVSKLNAIKVSAADGPQFTPVVMIDPDSDGKLSTGDGFVVYSPYFSPLFPFLDATRAYKLVDKDTNPVPLGSRVMIIASSLTVPFGIINPGDTVNITLDRGGVELWWEGNASANGHYVVWADMDPGWDTGDWECEFIVRPGEADEWDKKLKFKAIAPSPPTADERRAYDEVANPFYTGCRIKLVHAPSNSVVLDFFL